MSATQSALQSAVLHVQPYDTERVLPRLGGNLAFGGDYNPEQWPEEIWPKDVALMKQAGVNLVTIGVFGWAKLQPAEDTYDFEWLDRVFELLSKNSIGICLATGTASPPPWLSHRYPDVLPVTANGVQLQAGSRQHYSPSSSIYRKFARLLVEKLAMRYGEHRSLAGWHINNEYACHVQECHGVESTRAFRVWLTEKYKNIDELNKAWATAFWSQGYGDWQEIYTPTKAPYINNPTQVLDFKRFTSDAYLSLYRMELKVLRQLCPTLPVTTNLMGVFKPLNYWDWAPEMDFISWDSYPDPLDERAARQAAASGHDLMRSLRPGTPFILMEQATSGVNWRPCNRPKRPGLMRLWSLQTVARGGDGVMYFQWRASKAGAEKYHSAIIQHVADDDSRVFREVCALGAELRDLRRITGSVLKNKVAIAFDWNAWWAAELDSKPGKIEYAHAVGAMHAWFYEHNIGIDFVHPGANLRNYSLVVAPALYLLTAADAANLEEFVRRGGTLLVTYFSAIVDQNEHVVQHGRSSYLADVLGLSVEEWVPYEPGQTNHVRFDGQSDIFRATEWCDVLKLGTAKCMATFESDYFAGSPAVTRNDFSEGAAFYVGTRLDEPGLHALLQQVTAVANVRPVLDVPLGVEATLRQTPENDYLFLLNHTELLLTVPLGQIRGRDLLSKADVSETVTLAPLGASIIEFGGANGSR